jgi:tetratricopeptide (TPR) repeat protein
VRAAALLYLGDLRLGLFSHDALKLIGQAQALGLADPADRALAAGLLAPTSAEGLTHFRAAVQAEPAHRRANEMLFLTLMTLGRRTEAAERLAVLQAAYPRDGTTLLCSAILAAYDPHPATLTTHLDACRAHLAPDDVKALSLGLTTLRELIDVDVGSMDQATSDRLIKVMTQIALEGARLPAHRSSDGAGRRLVLPPALERSVGRLMDLQLLTNKARLIEALEQASAAHPEGTLYYLLGRLHYSRQDYRAARVALDQALQTPAILQVRRAALEFLLETEVQLTRGPHAFTEAQRPRLLSQLRGFVAEGGIRAANAGNLTFLAQELGDRELALAIAVAKVKLAPKDPIAHEVLGGVEFLGGNYARAVEHLERALALSANEAYGNHVRGSLAKARAKLREQSARLVP